MYAFTYKKKKFFQLLLSCLVDCSASERKLHLRTKLESCHLLRQRFLNRGQEERIFFQVALNLSPICQDLMSCHKVEITSFLFISSQALNYFDLEIFNLDF